MTPSLAKVIFALLAVGWYVIRFPYERRSRRTPVRPQCPPSPRNCPFVDSLTGLGILPFVYIATGFPRFAAYSFPPAQARIGFFVAIAALTMFRWTDKALGRNWSLSLEVRENHKLISNRVYRHLRASDVHGLLAVGCCASTAPPELVRRMRRTSWIRNPLFWPNEKGLMLENFGEEYRQYMST